MIVKTWRVPIAGTRFFACAKLGSLLKGIVSNITYMFMCFCKKMYTPLLFFSVICIGIIIAISNSVSFISFRYHSKEVCSFMKKKRHTVHTSRMMAGVLLSTSFLLGTVGTPAQALAVKDYSSAIGRDAHQNVPPSGKYVEGRLDPVTSFQHHPVTKQGNIRIQWSRPGV